MRSRPFIALTLLFSIIASMTSCGDNTTEITNDTVTPPR